MTSKHSLALGLVLGLALSFNAAEAGNRPTADNGFLMLNGEATREVNSLGGANNDGGGLSLYSVDAGPGCNNVATGAVYEMHCNAAGHFCPWGSDGGAGLAFCGTTIGSVAYGRPVNASTPTAPAPYYFVTEGNSTAGSTKNVCIVPASGSLSMTCALYRLK